jgi:penicillin-binding protein 1C
MNWASGMKRGAWAVGLVVLLLASVAAWVAWPLPGGLLDPGGELSLTLRDRHGVMLRSTRAADGNLARWLPLDRMDPDLLVAFLVMEDRRFYQHHGVDPAAVARALRDNLTSGRVVSGASTLTMQLARLLRPIDRSWLGKLEQTLWALRLEGHLSKQQILEQYLNRVPLGQGTVGVGAAARLYFDGSATTLSPGQAAMLAGLAHSPSSDNPLVSSGRAHARRTVALNRLRSLGYLTAVQVQDAQREPVLATGRSTPFLAPHFTTEWLRRADEDGTSPNGAWRTSLDIELQETLEGEVRHTVELLKDRGGRQAAAVVLDNTTGQVLAWVGSPDFWADTAGQVDMVVSARQPGSALKPFLYGLAFDRGYTAASVLEDIAHTYQTSTGPYHPRNYDRRFHGPVRAREALASSYNVSAVELVDRLGYVTLWQDLHEAGFASLDRAPEHYGLGLALGNGDVTLLELANGYRALANGGVWRPVQWLAGPEAAPFANAAGERRVMSAGSAALVLDILSDPAARVPGFGLQTPFDFPFKVAAKSGTSRHFTDNWSVGVTGNFTVAVWVGNFSGQPMDGVNGVTGAGPLLHRAILATAKRYPPGDFLDPSRLGAVSVRICRLSGLLAGPDCPTTDEWFWPGSKPGRECDWHRDGQVSLPVEYAEWLRIEGQTDPGSVITPRRDTHPASETTDFRITSPMEGDRYRIPPGVDPRYSTLALQAVGARPDEDVRWSVDGHPMGSGRWMLVRGGHAIRAETSSGRVSEVRITVE